MNALLPWLLAASMAATQEQPEVRQWVTFKFLPGKSREAIEIFREEALPLYEATSPMLRFRGYREAESPEPLDLVVVSTFQGMAGMDASNRTLREHAQKTNSSIGALYGRIGALSENHKDEFVEVDPKLSWGGSDQARLVVLISLQIEPGRTSTYETLVRDRLVRWEAALGESVVGSDGGPFLVSDGWDYFRVVGIATLGDWHRYVREQRTQPWWSELDEIVTRSKTLILAPVPELSVR